MLIDSFINILSQEIIVDLVMFHGFVDEACNSIDTIPLGMLEAGDYMLWLNTVYDPPEGMHADSITFTVDLVDGINNYADDFRTMVFPNPIQNNLNIELELIQGSDLSARIFNVHGELISSNHFKHLSMGTNNLKIDVGDVSSGIYFLSLETDNGQRMVKFIKN